MPTIPRGAVSASRISLAILLISASVAAADRTGEQIYNQQCAACHGGSGQGVPDVYPHPLAGNRPLSGLTKYIIEKMPEDAAEECVGEDAKKVAAYVYDAFYSKVAQARNKPPRVELARLTVRQYRHALADLLGGFRKPARPSDQHGLQGEYFNSGRRIRRNQRKLQRIDAQVDFDFGDKAPAEKVSEEEFAIRWSGGIFAPYTGEYEFIVETENGARLWVNDREDALIDRWVRSGNDTEHRESVFLLGGRYYPLRLECFKEKREKSASIRLKWKPPQRAEAIIPTDRLAPGEFPEVFVVQTPFPPDDRSLGYVRGSAISKAWDEASTYAALDTAAYVAANLQDLAGTRVNRSEAAQMLPEFCRQFVERAFRRPLNKDQQEFYVDRHFADAENLEIALKKCVLLALKSPRFLYLQPPAGKPNSFDVAERLSFALWDSIPDDTLRKAAEEGKLVSRETVQAQVRRMLADPRAKAKVRGFYYQWLNLAHLHELSKDRERFPEFDEQVVSDLRDSLDLFLDDVTWSDASDFRQLLLSRSVYLNGRLARFYGTADMEEGAAFEKVELDPQKQVGLMTHPLIMAGYAYDATSSPIHRGVFVTRSLLGRRLRPPPQAVTPLPPDLHPGLSTRERITLQTKPQACRTCHGMINALGFTLENFDAVGRFREQEKGKPVDVSGSYETLAGKEVPLNGPRALGAFLAVSPEAHNAFIERLFQHMIQQPMLAYGIDRPERLREFFVKHHYNIRELLVELVTSAALASGNNQNGKPT